MTLQGLGQTPLVVAIANAIAQEEGFNTSGTIAQRNNNPGNLRSWPGAGTSSGYAQFSTLAAGWAALYSQIQTNINRGLTLNQFFAGIPGVYPGYAPSSDGNQPAAYAAFVAGQVGIDPNVPLNSLDPTTFANSAPPTSTNSIALTPTSSLLCADGSPALSDGTCDDGSSPGATTEIYTPASVIEAPNWMAIGLALGIIALWWFFRE